MVYGYCRVSTQTQAKDGNSLEAQEQLLKENGAEEIYSDAFTGTKAHRPELDKLLAVLQAGDKLVITKLDRIARSASQGIELIQSLLDKGITVHVLNMGLLDNTPTGKLIRNIMLAFAEFERDMIIERTQEGKAIARRQPDFREGRPRLYNRKQIQHALDLLQDHSYRQVTELTGISKSTLIRAKNKAAAVQDTWTVTRHTGLRLSRMTRQVVKSLKCGIIQLRKGGRPNEWYQDTMASRLRSRYGPGTQRIQGWPGLWKRIQPEYKAFGDRPPDHKERGFGAYLKRDRAFLQRT